jgi:hypothetical protein
MIFAGTNRFSSKSAGSSRRQFVVSVREAEFQSELCHAVILTKSCFQWPCASMCRPIRASVSQGHPAGTASVRQTHCVCWACCACRKCLHLRHSRHRV